MTLQIHQKLLDRVAKQPDPTQVTHVRKQMHRITALLARIHREDLGQLVGNALKQNTVQILLSQQVAHRPKGFGTKITLVIRFIGDTQGIMPPDIKSILVNRFHIGEIMHLLKDHHAQHGIKLFGRAAHKPMVVFENLVHRKLRENLISEQFCPGGVHQSFALGTKKSKWIENVKSFVVFDMNHVTPYPWIVMFIHLPQTLCNHNNKSELSTNIFGWKHLSDFLRVHQSIYSSEKKGEGGIRGSWVYWDRTKSTIGLRSPIDCCLNSLREFLRGEDSAWDPFSLERFGRNSKW